MSNVDVTLDDILKVVRNGVFHDKVKRAREYVEHQYKKAKGKSKEECFALGILYPDMPVDQQTMVVIGMMKRTEDSVMIKPNWAKVIKIAAMYKMASKKKRAEMDLRLDAINRNTPFNLEGRSTAIMSENQPSFI